MIDLEFAEIVQIADKPTLVLAGPGSGKTYLLCTRVRHLLDLGVDSSNITVLAFGRDASANMKSSLMDPKKEWTLHHTELPHVSTMHALGYRIIASNPKALGLRASGFGVLDNSKSRDLIFRDAARILNYDVGIAFAANECKQTGACEIDDESPKCKTCLKYGEILSKCNYIDFDDQILMACKLLESDGGLLAEHQEMCHHLLIDEYQDINAAQFRLIVQ